MSSCSSTPHPGAPLPSPPLPYPRRRRQAGNAGHQMGCQSARVGWRTRGDQMSLVGHGCHGTAIPYSGWEAHRPASWGPGGLEAWIWISLGWGWARPKSSRVDQGHSTPLQRTPGRPTCTSAVAPSRMVYNVLQHIKYGACGGQNGRCKAARLGLRMRPGRRNRKSINAIFTDSHRRLAD